MRLVIGCDHAGLQLKEHLKSYLVRHGHEITDVGTHTEESIDYPDFGRLASEMVAGGEAERGILICGTGIGMSITANKIKGIRAALCTDSFMARMCRAHNDANILVLGARVIGTGVAEEILDLFLATKFEGGRHGQRLAKIAGLEC